MVLARTRHLTAILVLGIGMAASSATAQDAGGEPRGIHNARLEERSAGTDLADAMRAAAGTTGVVWVGYAVPAVRADGGMCCYEKEDGGTWAGGVCRLGRDGAGTSTVARDVDNNVELDGRREASVLARFEDGALTRIRAFSAACVIDAGDARVVWLVDVDGAASARWLAGLVGGWVRAGHRPQDTARIEGAISSLAMHAGTAAFEQLEDWATGRHPRKLREQAIFWLGAARGEKAWPTLVRLLNDSPDRGIRDRAVFAAYVSEQPGTVDLLIGAARNDDSRQVRRSALMWLAQLAGDRAVAAIQDAVDDPDTAMKRHAVFALSQLPVERGVPLLIDIVRENPNPEVRKQALFWLAQTGDERALALIEELLLGD